MRAFASDFDGTLYFMREDPPYRKADLEEIASYREQGNLFGVCTGRSLKGIRLVAEDKIDFDFYILASGSLILEKNYQEIYKKCISRTLLTQIYEECKELGELIIQANDTVYNLGKPYPLQTPISSLDDIPGSDIYGISVMVGTPERAKEISVRINDAYEGQLVAYPNKNIVDVVPYGCSKGQAIEIVKQHFGINQIAGIGDSYNDIPMLHAADISFTFFSSPEEVKNEATYVVECVTEAIQKWNEMK